MYIYICIEIHVYGYSSYFWPLRLRRMRAEALTGAWVGRRWCGLGWVGLDWAGMIKYRSTPEPHHQTQQVNKTKTKRGFPQKFLCFRVGAPEVPVFRSRSSGSSPFRLREDYVCDFGRGWGYQGRAPMLCWTGAFQARKTQQKIIYWAPNSNTISYRRAQSL